MFNSNQIGEMSTSNVKAKMSNSHKIGQIF